MISKLTLGVYTIAILFSPFASFGQDNIELNTRLIVEEGKLLYRCEMASWHGTDLVIPKLKDKENVGGYFSYPEQDLTKCIFFSRGDKPKVIGTITFDSSYKDESATIDLAERDFTPFERDIYAIRENALSAIKSGRFFKIPANTSLNLIPLIRNGEKKVYVVTGPKQSGVVIFGNDYLLTFDDANKLLDRQRIHASTIMLDYKKNQDKIGAMHTHVQKTGDLITATDICTLMLYQKFTNWKTHVVISPRYISTWDCKTNELTVREGI